MRTLALAGGLALAAGLGIALAGTPLGDGDDTGWVPPDKVILKCETGASKAASKYAGAVFKCHIKTAGAQMKAKPFDEEACEAAAEVKYDAAIAKLTGCPPCLDTAAIRANAEFQLDQLSNAFIFCDSTSGSQLGDGDDAGWVPDDKGTLACEGGVAKNVSKLQGAIAKCHSKSAAAQFALKVFDEEGCETAAKVKFNAALAKLVTCATEAPCLAPALPTLDSLIEYNVDQNSGPTFCQSPSGAFIDLLQ